MTKSPDALLVEPLEAVLALQHLLVPVAPLPAVAVGLSGVPLVSLVPLEGVPGVGQLGPRVLHMGRQGHLGPGAIRVLTLHNHDL